MKWMRETRREVLQLKRFHSRSGAAYKLFNEACRRRGGAVVQRLAEGDRNNLRYYKKQPNTSEGTWIHMG